jgi:hypothetical protein
METQTIIKKIGSVKLQSFLWLGLWCDFVAIKKSIVNKSTLYAMDKYIVT